uniref:Uncharacterized protein n=1 Tax=Oryza punctata TaxID=4537 RepID=A0A0E0JSM9_ORYPU
MCTCKRIYEIYDTDSTLPSIVRKPVQGTRAVYNCHTSSLLHETSEMRDHHTTRSFQIPEMPHPTESYGCSATTKVQELPGAATSFPRQETISARKAMNTAKQCRISFQAHHSSAATAAEGKHTSFLPSTNSATRHPIRSLPSKTLPSNGATPLRLLLARAGLLAGHLHMPPCHRTLPCLARRRWRGFSEEEPDGDVWP